VLPPVLGILDGRHSSIVQRIGGASQWLFELGAGSYRTIGAARESILFRGPVRLLRQWDAQLLDGAGADF
jgi:hypothetical protein